MNTVYENKELRNKTRVFTDRFDAGRAVADMLAPSYKGLPNLMVPGIPMGGIPLAAEVAKKLEQEETTPLQQWKEKTMHSQGQNS